MAAKTPDTVGTDALLTGRNATETSGFEHLTHLVFPFITENLDNADTVDIGIGNDQVVVRHAWEPTDTVQVNLAESSGVFTSSSAADNANGYLHVWIAG